MKKVALMRFCWATLKRLAGEAIILPILTIVIPIVKEVRCERHKESSITTLWPTQGAHAGCIAVQGLREVSPVSPRVAASRFGGWFSSHPSSIASENFQYAGNASD